MGHRRPKCIHRPGMVLVVRWRGRGYMLGVAVMVTSHEERCYHWWATREDEVSRPARRIQREV